MANNHMCQALVDTGSIASLIAHSFVQSLGLRIDTSQKLPQLMGITDHTVPMLGIVYLKVFVRQQHLNHMFFVVPDNLMYTELLLGVDILGLFPFSWDAPCQIIVWNGITYQVRMLRHRPAKRRMRRVKVVRPESPSTLQLRLKERLFVPEHTAGLYPVHTSEPPDTVLHFLPQPLKFQSHTELCQQVTDTKEVFLPLVNNSKSKVTIKSGTLLGSYHVVDKDGLRPPPPSCRKVKIQNDLLPQAVGVDCTSEQSRETQLKNLVAKQDLTHLSSTQQTQLVDSLCNNQAVFILLPNELGKIHDVQANIVVTDPTPVRSPTYRYPEKAKEIISSMLEEMEEKDIIEPSTAAWLSPIVLVKKPDGSQRMFLDHRKVNTHLQVDIHPLPRLEEMVKTAAGNKYYATLDMKDAYYQVELGEQSRDLTTFSDGVSLYRFKRLPFGLSCSPAIFSRIMGNMLTPLVKQGWVKNYLDDIILWAPSFSSLLKRLDTLYKHLSSHGVKLNVSKCHFGQPEVRFLGHIVSKDGCRPCQKNVNAVVDMKSPSNIKDV